MNFAMPGLDVVETPRLLLRRLVPTDAAAYLALMVHLRSDARVRTFLNLDRELLSVDEYAASIKHPRDRCNLAVIRKDSGAFSGVAGFLRRADFSAPEIYVWLAKENCGQGLGPETANALVNAVFQRQYCAEVIGIPHPENDHSIKSLAKMNMRQCASIVDIVELAPNVFEFGREHRFPVFCRHNDPKLDDFSL